jgi:hypothetical protein
MPSERQMLIFYLRPARARAVDAARFEVMSLFPELELTVAKGGPLSELGNIMWFETNQDEYALRKIQFMRLGYTVAVDLLCSIPESNYRDKSPVMLRWRKKPYRLDRLYEIDLDSELQSGPDQRLFLLGDETGGVREVKGYRGDGSALARRALPVCDCKLLVNIVARGAGGVVLDPFAGAGGIVREAVAAGLRVHSVDIDPILKPGLEHMGSVHVVGNADALPWTGGSIDAVITETPFAFETRRMVPLAFEEMVRVCKTGGRIAIMCTDWQAELLRKSAASSSLDSLLDTVIDRKGTNCSVLCWEKRK